MSTIRGRIDSWPARKNFDHNPFQSLLNDSLESQGWIVNEFSPLRSLIRRADIWHWHWPEGQFGNRSRLDALMRLGVLVLLLTKARLVRTSVVWTAHNVRGHETKNRFIENLFWSVFHKNVSAVHYLSESSKEAVLSEFPTLIGKPYVITRHGHYKDIYGEPYDKLIARRSLDLEATKPTVVFCGKVRAYKGVTDLIRAFTESSDLDAQLLIAGMALSDEENLVRQAASEDSRIRLVLRLLSKDEIKAAVSAADLVVLPYRSVTNSGSALMALSLNRPILAPNKGAIIELATETAPDWVTTYDQLNTTSIEAALAKSLGRDDSSVDLSAFDWDAVANKVSDLYVAVRRPNLRRQSVLRKRQGGYK